MSDSLISGFLPPEEISRPQIEENVCRNLLHMQEVNLFKNLFLDRICFKLHRHKKFKIFRITKYRTFGMFCEC